MSWLKSNKHIQANKQEQITVRPKYGKSEPHKIPQSDSKAPIF